MAVLSNFISLAFVYLVLVRFSECEECVVSGPCRCVFPNGTGVDLSPAMLTSSTKPFYLTKDYKIENIGNNTSLKVMSYYFHPCADYTNTSLPDSCKEPLSLYRNDDIIVESHTNATEGTFTEKHLCEKLGSVSTFTFSSDSRSIVYGNEPSDTKIWLTCTDGESQLHMLSNEDPNDIKLIFYSKHACLQQLEDPGRSFGSTLLIIFFSLLIFYLVLGVCTKKFLMGATGVEVIPNLAFWTDLPNLVKDGWAFAISGFKLPPRGVGPTASDPNSYDSI